MSTLDGAKQLVSTLWLDQPDAPERIEQRRAAGDLTDTEAERLRTFAERGYATLPLSLDADTYARFEADVDRAWAERPADLAVAKEKTRFSFADFDGERERGTRIPDLHSYSDVALDLYLNAEIHRIVSLILGEQPIAFQSLYFEYGSEQGLHRDPMFVVTQPASHLVASWTALQDVTPDCGPLLYVPGSHRLPWYEFDDDSVAMPQDVSQQVRAGWRDHFRGQLADMGLEVQEFTCSRGDAFIWHAGLLHGGRAVTNPASTRKSFVVHYSTAVHYTSRTLDMHVRSDAGGEWKQVSGTTSHRIERNGCVGLDAPLRGVGRGSSGSTRSGASLSRRALAKLKRTLTRS
jgi:ectoine hydroxylase-related dioxygenase (phytanoyl-CoA dioxygenase family)